MEEKVPYSLFTALELHSWSLLQIQHHLTKLKGKSWLNDNLCGGELAQKLHVSLGILHNSYLSGQRIAWKLVGEEGNWHSEKGELSATTVSLARSRLLPTA